MDFKAISNQGESFKFLLEKGLDPLAEDSRQRTPLDIGPGVGAKGILELFQRDGKTKEVVVTERAIGL